MMRMMRKSMMKNLFKHKHRCISGLSTQEKFCIATILGCTFIKGMCVGIYLGEK